MAQRLFGKVAIVTGAGQGIGKGIALRLAREGADVVVAEYNSETAASTAREIEAIGRRALAYPVDISGVGGVRTMVDDVVAEFGHVDILVNNAGLVQTKPMMELTEKDWDRVMDVNQRGLFFCLQAVAAQMIRQLPEELKTDQAPADVSVLRRRRQIRQPQGPRMSAASAKSSIYPQFQAGGAVRCPRTTLPARRRSLTSPNRPRWLWPPTTSTSMPYVLASCPHLCGTRSTKIAASSSVPSLGRP